MFNSFWYLNLNKPQFSPPDWLFAPVWSVLYILIFVSLAIYINSEGENKKTGYLLFAVQMFLNLIWTPVFFKLKSIKYSLIVAILLGLFVFLTILKFYKISKISALLLIPYFIWILFAIYLNIEYLILN